MPSTLTTTLIEVATGLVAIVFLIGLRGVFARREWDLGASLTFGLIALLAALTEILVTILDQWHETIDAFHNDRWVEPAWAYTAQLGLFVVLAFASVVLVVRRLRAGDGELNVPALLMLAVTALTAAAAVLNGDQPIRPFYVVFVCVMAAVVVAPRGLGVHVGIGTFSVFSALTCGVLLAVHPEFTVFGCSPAKCGVLDFNFRGFLENENAIALFLTLTIPFVYLGFGRCTGAVLAAYTTFLVCITGSRSGLTAAVVTFAALLVLRPDVRRPRATPLRTTLLYTALGLGLSAGVLVPYLVDDPSAFTGRAYLWSLVRGALADPQTLGLGAGMFGWQHFREIGLIDFSAVYSVHNQWLQVVFETGLLGCLLMVTALAVLVYQAGPAYRLVLGCVLVPVVTLGVTERPWSLDSVDWLAWSLPATLLCYPVVRRAARRAAAPEADRAAAGSRTGALAAGGPGTGALAATGAGGVARTDGG